MKNTRNPSFSSHVFIIFHKQQRGTHVLISNFKIFFQQKQNIQTQQYTSTQDNADIKSKICERASLGIQPSTMNVARRSTHNPRAQHQHVCHCMFGMVDLALFGKETSWWNTMLFALCGRPHGPHAYKSSTQTGICTEGTRASSVEWTQHKMRSSPQKHIARTSCGTWCYVIIIGTCKNMRMPNCLIALFRMETRTPPIVFTGLELQTF